MSVFEDLEIVRGEHVILGHVLAESGILRASIGVARCVPTQRGSVGVEEDNSGSGCREDGGAVDSVEFVPDVLGDVLVAGMAYWRVGGAEVSSGAGR
eukprot:9606224-Lingulodinium_polyedra.AAC.1